MRSAYSASAIHSAVADTPTQNTPRQATCIAMNGDIAQPGQLVVSTSNRNFEGRQGPGARTVLASPRVAAACALAGCIADPRDVTLAGTEQAA